VLPEESFGVKKDLETIHRDPDCQRWSDCRYPIREKWDAYLDESAMRAIRRTPIPFRLPPGFEEDNLMWASDLLFDL